MGKNIIGGWHSKLGVEPPPNPAVIPTLHLLYLHHVAVRALRDGVHCGTDVVNDTHNARRVFTLDQLADDLVVEIVDWLPLDSFAHVLFLQTHGVNEY